MDYRLESEQYARIYGCTPRSIRNYEQSEAPLDEPESMYHWLWKRRTQPSGFAGKTVAELTTAYAKATARGSELDNFLREEIRDCIRSADIDQTIVRCKLLAAEQRGYVPEYRDAIRAAMDMILDGVRKTYAALGLSEDDRFTLKDQDDDPDEETEDEDAEEPADNIVRLPIQSSTAAAPYSNSEEKKAALAPA